MAWPRSGLEMAQLFDQHVRIVPTWLTACGYLFTQTTDGREARNLVLEVSDPVTFEESDKTVVKEVDAAIRSNKPDLSIETVANTIFPEGLYRRYGRPDFYQRYERIMARAKKPGTWGTYAMRLFGRGGADARINPIEIVVEKLRRASTVGHGQRAVYEVGVIDPVEDLANSDLDFGCEVPTYDPTVDARMVSNMPCLSHLSFKMTRRTHVDLTAIYRSHYYCARTLGNFIGLSRLLSFVASESGLYVGTLTCVSTHAVLDVSSWGGLAATRELLTASAATLGR